ncbi:MAG: DNA recombination protein RmuC [Dehalococcoidales bacterium]|nr:MAG: DNA recombination protein RmuC [Dehalococcoidales bacterium]
MEIFIIILLAIVVLFLIWDRLWQEKRWREQRDALSKTIGERLEGSMGVFGEVNKSLGKLEEGTRQIEAVGRNIASLQEVLRAPKFRGGLGELMLERLLDDILPHQNYKLQHRFESGEAVDAVIQIGDNLVPIDSKFPLEDFQRVLAAESDRERDSMRRQFTRTVKKHIDNVTKYILPDEGTFDFALMYIPAENVYYETILRDGAEGSEVYSYALQKRVIPVSPNSFYAYLQVIILGLKGLHIENTASEILRHLARLQGEFEGFQEDYDTLGGHIRHAATKYDDAGRKLARFEDKLRIAVETPVEKLPEGKETTDDTE